MSDWLTDTESIDQFHCFGIWQGFHAMAIMMSNTRRRVFIVFNCHCIIFPNYIASLTRPFPAAHECFRLRWPSTAACAPLDCWHQFMGHQALLGINRELVMGCNSTQFDSKMSLRKYQLILIEIFNLIIQAILVPKVFEMGWEVLRGVSNDVSWYVVSCFFSTSSR